MLCSFGKLNKVIFPLQPKTHFFRDILRERVPCSAAEWSALMGALLLSLRSMRARARSSGRNAHIRSSTVVYVSKSHDWKKLSETCTNPEGRFVFATEILIFKSFFETLAMLSMRIQLFNSVNNSEWTKQHCTPPLIWNLNGMTIRLNCTEIEIYMLIHTILIVTQSWCC